MIHVRIRVGSMVREGHFTYQQAGDLDGLEQTVDDVLHRHYNIPGYTLEYLGRRSWDILLDGQKIGHVKAWEIAHEPSGTKIESFWPNAVIAFLVYAALCMGGL